MYTDWSEPFCRCGHRESQHAPGRGDRLCVAKEPEPTCGCRGYRLGKRCVKRELTVDELRERRKKEQESTDEVQPDRAS